MTASTSTYIHYYEIYPRDGEKLTDNPTSDTFTPAARAIFAKPVLAHVASLGPEGEPNVTPVWVELDGDDIVINTALGRAKARNLASDSRVAVTLSDPDDAQTAIAVRGTVVGFTTDGADVVIDRLAKKYLGTDSYPFRKLGEIRVTVRIRPDRISMQPK
jgi:PPOX class probable F420-dependent enzyme